MGMWRNLFSQIKEVLKLLKPLTVKELAGVKILTIVISKIIEI